MRADRIARQRDDGVVLIMVALLLTALLVIVALVIDIGFVRQNRQEDKSAADFAAAAGVRGLDDGSGYVKVWKGICTARDFLVANEPELSPLSAVDASGSPISDPCLSPPGTICAEPSTWGTYRGVADGGRLRVTIKNGYDLSSSDFDEDAGAYVGDNGDGPCDNIAVIIEEREGARFGGVAGAQAYQTRTRSVGRLVQGTEGDVVAALVLLERRDCQALDNSGTADTVVVVEGRGTTPGVIHSDSLGNGNNCNRTIFDVDGSTPAPRIVVGRAPEPDPETGVNLPGLISAVSLSDAAGAVPTQTSPGIHAVCAQVAATDCAGSGGGSGPTARRLLGRSRVDARYRVPILALRNDAATRFTWTAATVPAGYEIVTCNDARTSYTSLRIFVDCGNRAFNATGKTFAASVEEVVISADVALSGSLRFVGPTRVFIGGNGGNSVSLTNGTELRLNDGSAASCADRPTPSTTRATLVLGSGRINAGGGLLRMCNTTLFLMDGGMPSGACPIPTSDGVPPYGNTCAGNLSVSGGAQVDWSAPNAKDDPNSPPVKADYDQLEDLALWSETSGAGGSAWGVAGSGGLYLSGIYFTPNADPFTLGGGGSINIRDAQFITRKLNVAGGGVLTMSPEAHNSVLFPVLGGFTLVR